MNFISIRIITADVDRPTVFYARLTGRMVDRPHPLFANLPEPSGVIAIASERTLPAMAPAALEPATNSSVIVEFGSRTST